MKKNLLIFEDDGSYMQHFFNVIHLVFKTLRRIVLLFPGAWSIGLLVPNRVQLWFGCFLGFGFFSAVLQGEVVRRTGRGGGN